MKHKIAGYLVASLDQRGQPLNYTIMSTKMSEYAGFCFISEVEVEVEVPDNFNFTAVALEKLQMQKQLVRAKAARDLLELDTRIQELQALEMA